MGRKTTPYGMSVLWSTFVETRTGKSTPKKPTNASTTRRMAHRVVSDMCVIVFITSSCLTELGFSVSLRPSSPRPL